MHFGICLILRARYVQYFHWEKLNETDEWMNEWNRQTNWVDRRSYKRTDKSNKKKISIPANAECCCFAEPEIDVTWAMNWIYAANGHAHFIWFLWIRKRWAKPNTNTHSELYTMRTMEYKFHLESMRRCIQWDKEFDILQWINELHWSRCRKRCCAIYSKRISIVSFVITFDRSIDWLIIRRWSEWPTGVRPSPVR